MADSTSFQHDPDKPWIFRTYAGHSAISEFSLPSVMMAKECVNRAYEGGLGEGILFERRMFHALFATADQKEGMSAFIEKRKPAFKNV